MKSYHFLHSTQKECIGLKLIMYKLILPFFPYKILSYVNIVVELDVGRIGGEYSIESKNCK